jgi:putative photosynthetic complex assembly protein
VASEVTNNSSLTPVPLVLAIALVCSALAVAFGARLSDVGTTHLDYTRPSATRDLLFEDRSDGSISVKDADTREQIGEIVPGNDGFVRTVMRIIARERLIAGGAKSEPFTLIRWDNGRLTISDPATGRKTELVGFGASNEEAFAKFLPQRRDQR